MPDSTLLLLLQQANFTTEAQLQQHLAGPVHKKAEKKAAELAAKQQHQSQFGTLAADALQAAAWHDSRSAEALNHGRGQQQQRRPQQQQQGQRQQQPRNHHAAQQPQQQESLTHEQVLASARQADPLSLNGESAYALVAIVSCCWMQAQYMALSSVVHDVKP